MFLVRVGGSQSSSTAPGQAVEESVAGSQSGSVCQSAGSAWRDVVLPCPVTGCLLGASKVGPFVLSRHVRRPIGCHFFIVVLRLFLIVAKGVPLGIPPCFVSLLIAPVAAHGVMFELRAGANAQISIGFKPSWLWNGHATSCHVVCGFQGVHVTGCVGGFPQSSRGRVCSTDILVCA